MEWIYDDGGRALAGYKGDARDCGVRAIAIATGNSYKSVYEELYRIQDHSPRLGVYVDAIHKYLGLRHWVWEPCMFIGSGCIIHLKSSELPPGDIVCRLSRHYAAVIDRVLHDTYDCSHGGTRCLYGYWSRPNG